MPNPAKYKNTEEGHKKYMEDCMHQTLHMERKDPEQAKAICINRWREEHGPKQTGKKPKKKVADILRNIATFIKE